MSDYREVIGGMMGDIPWKPVLPPSGLTGLKVQGKWTRDGDMVLGEAREGATFAFGDDTWKDYELSMRVKGIAGGNIQILFRIGPEGYYLMDFLLGWKAVAVSKNDRRPGGRGFHKISVVNFDACRDREYEAQVAVRDASITTYVDGELVNQVTDYDFSAGSAALSVWGGRTEFRDLRYRLLS